MVEGIKVGGFASRSISCNGDFIEFEYLKARLISHALKKVLLLDCRGKISPLIKYSIIKF
ncbi:hypothetical protein [Helicobacter pylori]|uniref:hypothetical protein n=1 Tax=Helicobacter pylori TaxID=210 RepID=UPI001E38E651|nr:hypothetical protein [Helicobacter pylori]UOR94103.1 hypothetical protein MPG22_04380 [Helicobacter pylori]UOR95527.1 hypothetical protein MPG48_04385 [Helicobacter pylori]